VNNVLLLSVQLVCSKFSKLNIVTLANTVARVSAGHFLLTNLLLGDLKQTASDGGDARIVVITSTMHDIEVAKKRGREYSFIHTSEWSRTSQHG
jgi:hypothetical protein